ncbi:MAG: hypothetical protein WAU45_24155 [Blastocatellia bacterium]
MTKDKIGSTNGKDRRVRGERRKADRREPERQPKGSVLTTRKTERRKKSRRSKHSV